MEKGAGEETTPSVFFLKAKGDTRKCSSSVTTMAELHTLTKKRFQDSPTIQAQTSFEYFTIDQAYSVRHKVEKISDIYEGAVLEIVMPDEKITGKRNVPESTDASEGSDFKKRKTEPPEERWVVRLRGLPWEATRDDVLNFFNNINVTNLHIIYLPNGRATGEAIVELETQEHYASALERNNQHLGHRYIEVFKSTADDMDRALGINKGVGGSGENKIPFSQSSFVVRMRGLPFSSLEEDIREFFAQVGLNALAVHIVREEGLGRPSGIAYVEFQTQADQRTALTQDRKTIGSRYIELFPSKVEELCRAMGVHGTTPLAGYATQPWAGTAGMAAATGGTSCIKMRGLPFNSTEVDITRFFQEAGVTPVRIHRKADGAESFVEFLSSTDADKAMTRQKAYMKNRYIELFRVSFQEVARTVGLAPVQPGYGGFPPGPMMGMGGMGMYYNPPTYSGSL